MHPAHSDNAQLRHFEYEGDENTRLAGLGPNETLRSIAEIARREIQEQIGELPDESLH